MRTFPCTHTRTHVYARKHTEYNIFHKKLWVFRITALDQQHMCVMPVYEMNVEKLVIIMSASARVCVCVCTSGGINTQERKTFMSPKWSYFWKNQNWGQKRSSERFGGPLLSFGGPSHVGVLQRALQILFDDPPLVCTFFDDVMWPMKSYFHVHTVSFHDKRYKRKLIRTW